MSYPSLSSSAAASSASLDYPLLATSVDSSSAHSEPIGISSFGSAVDRLRHSFLSGLTRPLSWRRSQLSGLRRFVESHEESILAALYTDLHKNRNEAAIGEILLVLDELAEFDRHLDAWASPRSVSTPLTAGPGSCYIRPEPHGVTLIIGPFNYPFQLLILPLMAAFAAGNCAVIKPSELTPNISRLVSEHLPRYVDPRALLVVEGGIPETSALLAIRFDFIFFTGSEVVGKIVAAAAARHLTPTVLELGGKSPAIVAADADLALAARRIAWGKFMNSGQTCIAPDFIWVDRSVRSELEAEVRKVVKKFFGSDAQTSGDYGRIVNERHVDRLAALIEAEKSRGTLLMGGRVDRNDRYVEPTLVSATLDSPTMQSEIFGPILPILEYERFDEIIQTLQRKERALALYLFSSDSELEQRLLDGVLTGSYCRNDCVMQAMVPGMPFGGTGTSGIGSYHGQFGFTAFSHQRACLVKSTRGDISVRYPPSQPNGSVMFGRVMSIDRFLRHYRTQLRLIQLAMLIGLVAIILWFAGIRVHVEKI